MQIIEVKDRINTEDALKHIHSCEYQGKVATMDSLAGALSMPRKQVVELVEKLDIANLITTQHDGFILTPCGLEYALQVIRAHRLYETYLAQQTGMPATDWHPQAEIVEHRLSKAEVDHLAEQLGHPRYDPHGDPIPTRDGEIPPQYGECFSDLPVGWEGKITHIEDEPEAVYSKIISAGLALDLNIRIVARDEHHLRLKAEGRDIMMTLPMAANIQAVSLKRGESVDLDAKRLSSLAQGEKARVIGLALACRGAERNRLLDLGLVPGSAIEMDFQSMFQSPVAYRVRGSLIALRKEQTDHVLIQKI